MRDVLFLVHRIPYPPEKGDKIRSHHWLRFLAQDFRVHLGTFIDHPEDWVHVEALRSLCARTCVLGLRRLPALARSVFSLATGEPLSVACYRDRRMQRFVDTVLREVDIDAVLVFSSTMAQYVKGPRFRALRRVIDFVDVDSDKWRQYGEHRGWPMRWIWQREGVLLGREERRIAREFDASVFTSRAEIDLFTQLAPEIADRVHCVRNGVDLERFDPGRDYPNPYRPDDEVLVFVGEMSYWPNVDAVRWFASDVFPAVRARRPQARFYIVGAHPVAAVLALDALPGVHVTGGVPDVRPYLAHARLAVAPMRLARGIQNKVLEALAMDLPVLLTRSALIGIGRDPAGSGMTVATPADMAEKAVALLADRAPQGGRAFAVEHFPWEPAYAELERIVRSQAPFSRFAGRREKGV